MKIVPLSCLIMAGLIGCGSSAPPLVTTPIEYLNIVNLEGEQDVIETGELLDDGEPIAKSVLALDRGTGQEVWVSYQELVNAPPNRARYLPVTSPEPRIRETPAPPVGP